jgi:hypothetical protein
MNDMTVEHREEGVRLTPVQVRRRRARSIAIALALFAFVAIFYAVTIVRIGGNIAASGMGAAGGL